MRNKNAKQPGDPGVAVQRVVGMPVQVWWGLEWVTTVGWQEDDKTISARLVTRTGETKMCRIRNTKNSIGWKHPNGLHERPGATTKKDTNAK